MCCVLRRILRCLTVLLEESLGSKGRNTSSSFYVSLKELLKKVAHPPCGIFIGGKYDCVELYSMNVATCGLQYSVSCGK